MIIRHLTIANFRGIRTLDWHPNGRFLCLIGPNDATKTTILEAIELVSLPRYNAYITDADFHDGDTSNCIVIEATFGEVPQELLDENSKFGLFLRGYDATTKALSPAPVDGLLPVLTVRFQVGQDLEPAWVVIHDGAEPKRITWQDRERLGVNYLGRDVERHLTWARGSALSKLTDLSGAPTAQVVAAVAREANRAFSTAPKKELLDAAAAVGTQAAQFGAAFKDLKPGLDISGLSFGASAFGLQESTVPSRLWGLGTKRLAALATQQKGVGNDSILLIDEIETGLEPHRVRHLVDCLFKPDGAERTEGQVIFTSHSPSAVIPLPVERLRFVRCDNGETKATAVTPAYAGQVQGYARQHAQALFGRKVLICEGATEVGLCRGLADTWTKQRNGWHPTHVGFVPVDGGGCTKAPNLALELKRIGYDVAVLADSDEPLNPDVAVLAKAGIPVFLWDDRMAAEERIATDIPTDDLQKLVDKAVEIFGEDRIHGQIRDIGRVTVAGTTVTDWFLIHTEAEIRAAIGRAAKQGRVDGGKGWFKNVTMGLWLGNSIGPALQKVPASPLSKKITEVADWIYA